MAAVEHGSLPREPACDKLLSAQVDRRRLLGLGLGAAGGFFLDPSVVARELTPRVETPEPDFVKQIKEFEAAIGNEKLSFSDAKNTLAPLVADLFANVAKPNRSPEEVLNRTYFIGNFPFSREDDATGDPVIFPTGERVTSQTIRTLIADYPKTNFTYGTAQEILAQLSFDDEILGFTLSTPSSAFGPNQASKTDATSNDGVYLFLDRLNRSYFDPADDEHTGNLEYDAIEHEVSCQPVRPAVTVRSALLHEWLHDDVKKESPGGIKHGFIETTMKVVPIIEELTADLFSASASIRYDLPYKAGYSHKPQDLKNYLLMQLQAGITIKELLKLHRHSKFNLFMLKLAISVPLREEKVLKLSRELPYMFYNRLSGHPNWKLIKMYFRDVDAGDWMYDGPYASQPAQPPARSGCIILPHYTSTRA